MKAIMSCGVYAIINVLTEIMYVGSSVEIENRWYGSQGHFTLLLKGDHDNSYLQAAFNKYGEEAFTFEILELTSKNKKKRLEREQYWMNLVGFENLYNISPIAGGGYTGPFSEEVLEKISEKAKNFYQTEKGKEKRKRLSEFMKGKQNGKGCKHPHSEETKRRIKETWRDPELRARESERNKGENNPMFGKHHSEVARKKQSGKNKGHIAWNKGLTKESDERVSKYIASRIAKRRKTECLV